MNLAENLLVIRRRWLVIAIAAIAGAVAGFISAPGSAGPVTYGATHTLIVDSQGGASINLDQAALLVTTGQVPDRVANRMGVDRSHVTSRVSASADTTLSVIEVTASSTDPTEAERLADTSAEELINELASTGRAAYTAEVERLNTQVATARARIGELDKIAAETRDPGAATAAQEARGTLAQALQALQERQAQGEPPAGLRTLEEASASALAQGGITAPKSKPVRAALLGVFGLLLGLGAAFGLDRLDTRIRSKQAAEEAFGAPVVAEIPPLPKGVEGQLLSVANAASPIVEAYRTLRTIVALWTREDEPDFPTSRVLIVTSPLAGEGKTTTVAHLAAMLAEVGRSVIAVSADLRKPRIHAFFGKSRDPGITDVLGRREGAPTMADLDLDTNVEGVRLLPSGPPTQNPAPILEDLADLIRAARQLADFVIIDTPPLLVASDASVLAQAADGVLLMARSGRTSIRSAQRSAELLTRLDAPVIGIVLAGAEEGPTGYGYRYGYKYYGESDESGALSRLKGKPSTNGAAGTTKSSPTNTGA